MPINQRILFRVLTAALVMQIVSVGYYLYYVGVFGYLPSPFPTDKFDTFMDLYNTLWWGGRDGKYSEWHSIYPPLNFIFLDSIRDLLVWPGMDGNSVELRAGNIMPAWVMIALYLTAPVMIVLSPGWKVFSKANRMLVVLVVTLSPVLLFGMERANLIVLPLFLLPFILSGEDNRWKPLLLAIVINLKPYLAILIFAYALMGDGRRLLQCLALSGAIFLLTGLVNDPNFPLFLQNIRGFAGGAVLKPRELLSMPASPSALTRSILMLIHTPGSAASQIATLPLLPPLIELIKTAALVIALCGLFLRRRAVTLGEAFVVLLVVIMTAGIWAGGYSQIFYLAAIPVLLRMRFRSTYLLLVLAIFVPWDLITTYSEPLGFSQSFLTGQTVSPEWQIGLGTFVRPFLNTLLLVILGVELMMRKTSATTAAADGNRYWNLIPRWRFVLPAGVAGLALGALLYFGFLSTVTAVSVVQVDAGAARNDMHGFLRLLLERRSMPQLVAEQLKAPKIAEQIADRLGALDLAHELATPPSGDGRLLARLTEDARFLEIRINSNERTASLAAAGLAAQIAVRLNETALLAQSREPSTPNWSDARIAGLISGAAFGKVESFQSDSFGRPLAPPASIRVVAAPMLDTPVIYNWQIAALIGAIACGALAYAVTLPLPSSNGRYERKSN